MKNLTDKLKEFEQILKEKRISFKSIEVENGFVKLTNEDEHILYFTPDLKLYTHWAKSIIIEDGFVKVVCHDDTVCEYSLDLEDIYFYS